MAYKYRHFIPQNTAPKGATQIEMYDSKGKNVCSIPLGGLTPPTEGKLYSFGLMSDMHLYKSEPSWMANTKFDNALTYFENAGCVMCAHSGDSTNSGFYNDGDSATFDPAQFAKYKAICDRHTIPVYGICGNHESYMNPITNNLTELKAYTGTDLYYTVSHRNDLFVFIGQPRNVIPMSDAALQWLYETLEANRNKRCFVFVHPDISSGNPLGAYTSNRLFDSWGTKTTAFKKLLVHYKNTILFHGHSHFLLECQKYDTLANYSENDGFRSVHVPSLSRPCDIIDGVRTSQDIKSQGYIVDVYEDCIVLNGMDFIDNKPVPLGTYRIDTTLQTISANTFTDSTGTITT